MAQPNQASSRAAALARRKALSNGGKKAVSGQKDRVRVAPERTKPEIAVSTQPKPVAAPAAPVSSPAPAYRPRVVAPAANSSRSASLARRKALSSRGKTASSTSDRTRDVSMLPKNQKIEAAVKAAVSETPKTSSCDCGCKDRKPAVAKPLSRVNKKALKAAINPSKAAALARRKAQSSRGKAGLSAGGMTQAQTARATNPDLSSRELAQAVREQRSNRGSAGQKKSRPTGKVRVKPDVGAAQDAPWKVGASETARGQVVTGTMVSRDKDVTGNEASTCRSITGTEYMGADVFRDFCQAEPGKTPMRTGISATASGNTVTGNKVGRSTKVTGDEPGTCKNVTGTEYLAAGESEAFCGTPSKPSVKRQTLSETRKGFSVTGDNVGSFSNVTGGEAGAQRELTGTQYMKTGEAGREPAKVRNSSTLRGGNVTGTAVGRSSKTTGDEPGSCRAITGDEYLGAEQFNDFCESKPQPADQKVGVSSTFKGMSVTGTMEGRSNRVTGNEPGTCKAVTGTPYAGVENYAGFCEAPAANKAAERMQGMARSMAKNISGLQPAIGGTMTGDSKGACEPVTGTPYIGADQMAQACPAVAAEINSSDFPQAVGESGLGEFSVAPPSHAAVESTNTGVTGSRYEQGRITGPFGMASGKVTGTEEARFGKELVNSSSVNEVVDPVLIDGRVKSRVTGEGMEGGAKITGDDWNRGDHVTGTEGVSARGRNPSVRGPMSAMSNKGITEVSNEAPQPVSRVTGSSGNYEGGSLITYSGGARG